MVMKPRGRRLRETRNFMKIMLVQKTNERKRIFFPGIEYEERPK